MARIYCDRPRALTRTPNVTPRLRSWNNRELRLQLPICRSEIITGFLEAAQITRPVLLTATAFPPDNLRRSTCLCQIVSVQDALRAGKSKLPGTRNIFIVDRVQLNLEIGFPAFIGQAISAYLHVAARRAQNLILAIIFRVGEGILVQVFFRDTRLVGVGLWSSHALNGAGHRYLPKTWLEVERLNVVGCHENRRR